MAKLFQCDWCDKQKSCKPMNLDGKVYDVCAECRAEIADKLKGKGEAAANSLIEQMGKFTQKAEQWPNIPRYQLGEITLLKQVPVREGPLILGSGGAESISGLQRFQNIG